MRRPWIRSPTRVPTGIGSSPRNSSRIDRFRLVLAHDVAVGEAWTERSKRHFCKIPVAGAATRGGRAAARDRECTDHLAVVDHAQAARQGRQHRVVPVVGASMAVVLL